MGDCKPFGTFCVAGGIAPTDSGACRAVCGGMRESRSDSACGEIIEASQRYSNSALIVRMDRLTCAW